MQPLAVDGRGQRLVEVRAAPEPGELRLLDVPCPLALAVIVHGEHVLLGLNRWRQEWELPGGLIEPAETARAAARRELHEETGLEVADDQLSWAGLAVFDLVEPTRRELAATFSCRLPVQPKVISSDELIEVGWYALDAPPPRCSPLDLALAEAVMRG